MSWLRTNDYGFQWGPFSVTRLMSYKHSGGESTVLGVETAHHKVEVRSSRTGRSVRVWIDGKEVKP